MQNLHDAILLAQAALTCPQAEGLEVFEALLLWPNITHLDHDERVLVSRASGKKHVCIKLMWCALDTTTEVLQKRGHSRTVEVASREEAIRCRKSQI